MVEETFYLPAMAPGTERVLSIHRYGHKFGVERRQAYLQASLHADELPGMLVLHHLERRLAAAEAAGQMSGEVTVVPVANPIGLAQSWLGQHAGRYDAASGENFNRRYPLLGPVLAEAFSGSGLYAGRLSGDGAANVALIRAAARWWLREQERRRHLTELEALRLRLCALAVGADLVLDLHCDFAAVMHLYAGTPLWPAAADLAADLGAEAVLTAEVSGGEPFDEALGGFWWELARRFPGVPIPPACCAVTVELRGESDVDDALADQDAAALFRVLQRRGFISGDPGPLPMLRREAVPFAAVEMVRASMAGLVTWAVPVGAVVAPGALIGHIVEPGRAGPGARHPVRAGAGGVLFGRVRHALVRRGQIVAKVAADGEGARVCRTGYLLTD